MLALYLLAATEVLVDVTYSFLKSPYARKGMKNCEKGLMRTLRSHKAL